MKTIEYDIATGSKEDFYTLWKTTRVDLRPRNEKGEVIENFRENSFGGNMYYHVHIKFVQNLAKTKDAAIKKAKELGISVPDSYFDFDIKHLTKPSFEAFGVSLKFKGGKWYAKASKEFFDCWKINKDEMRKNGWSCWKHDNVWYMCVRIEN